MGPRSWALEIGVLFSLALKASARVMAECTSVWGSMKLVGPDTYSQHVAGRLDLSMYFHTYT